LSRYFTLKTGDLIFTGTPAGVGPVKKNDRLQAYIEDELLLDFMVK
jgi:2-keto-4-pentenoate hydratase/2-oxohepta-3-ene-1,7-dioic acid hydratase in catechol pathway